MHLRRNTLCKLSPVVPFTLAANLWRYASTYKCCRMVIGTVELCNRIKSTMDDKHLPITRARIMGIVARTTVHTRNSSSI